MLPTQQVLLNELSKSKLIDCGYFALAAEEIAQFACRGLNTTRASVWLMSKDETQATCAALLFGDVLREIDNLKFSRQQFPAYFLALADDQPIVADDVHTHPATRDFGPLYTSPLDIRSILNVPIRINSKLVGCVAGESTGTQRSWTNDEIGYISALAEIAARALAAEAKMQAQEEVILVHASLEAQVSARTRSLKTAIEQLQLTQRQLIESAKMAALGGLVAGVAHEINTPLGVSVTAASHLHAIAKDANASYQAGKLDHDAFEQYLAEVTEGSVIILRNLERAAQLITSFKRVAVNQTDERVSKFNLLDVVQDLVHSLRPECKRKNVSCSLTGDGNIVIESYPSALDQILTNLVINALRHAFPNRKRGQIAIHISADANFAQLEVRDDGEGIATEIAPRIFEPFVTSKRDSGGTGLGLHIAYNLVTQKLRGTLAAESVPGEGATFTIRIPRASAPLPPEA